MKKYKGSILLLITAMIWGFAFVAQSVSMNYVGPFTFCFCRNILAGVMLLMIWPLFRDRSAKVSKDMTIKGGISCGIILGTAMALQQIGIASTTVGKAGFITALYIVMVPVFSIMFFNRKVSLPIIIGVILAVTGLYFLTMSGELTIGKGDLFVLGCAVVYALHILCIDHYSPHADSIMMSCIQFFVAAGVSFIGVLLREKIEWNAIMNAIVPIAYAGIMSNGVAYTLQIIGQKDTNPTVASLIMSLESVFSVLAGWLLLGQKLSMRESLGCILVFAAVILAQLPDKKE